MNDLDRAFVNMSKPGADQKARVRYLIALANTEMHLVLDEPLDAGETISPKVVEENGVSYCMAYDAAEKFADYQSTSEFVAMPGRILAGMLVEAELGLLVNPGSQASGHIVEPEALVWIVNTLEQNPEVQSETVMSMTLAGKVSPRFSQAIGELLARSPAEDPKAFLAGAEENTLILFAFGFLEDEHMEIARAIGEIATVELTSHNLDVAFPAPTPAILAQLEKYGQEIIIPTMQKPVVKTPGMDPKTPPKLR